MPFIAPHTPLDAPEELKAKYADIPDDRKPTRSKNSDHTRRISKLMLRDSARPIYAAVVDGMDQAIGRVLKALDDEGITDDTIVLFFSDNGGAAYALGGADNVPLRGGKGDTFEGGIRVVAAIRWPSAIAAGSKIESIMSVLHWWVAGSASRSGERDGSDSGWLSAGKPQYRAIFTLLVPMKEISADRIRSFPIPVNPSVETRWRCGSNRWARGIVGRYDAKANACR